MLLEINVDSVSRQTFWSARQIARSPIPIVERCNQTPASAVFTNTGVVNLGAVCSFTVGGARDNVRSSGPTDLASTTIGNTAFSLVYRLPKDASVPRM
jgi:hypothetical protein